MWSNFISFGVAAVVAIFSFFAGAKAYYYGLSAGLKISGEKQAIEPPKIVPARHKKLKPSKETEKINAILANIERYDGSDLGQEEIE